jgi:hypothetical protein
MALRETILGWLRQDPDKTTQERAGEANEIDRAYGNEAGDTYTEQRLGGGDHFDDDQRAPGR